MLFRHYYVCFVLACTAIVAQSSIGTRSAFSQEQKQKPDSPNTPAETAAPPAEHSIAQFRGIDLPSVDQLVLVLSNSTDAKGNRQEVLVFLGRTKNRGWETVGLANSDELSEHWRSVAQRVLTPYTEAGLSTHQLQKIQLAVEVSIAQFQRVYQELRTDFLDQPDQKSRLAVLANDNRYEQLRQFGREGIFRNDSLVAKVINKVLADAQSESTNMASPSKSR